MHYLGFSPVNKEKGEHLQVNMTWRLSYMRVSYISKKKYCKPLEKLEKTLSLIVFRWQHNHLPAPGIRHPKPLTTLEDWLARDLSINIKEDVPWVEIFAPGGVGRQADCRQARLWRARSQLSLSRSLQGNFHFAAFSISTRIEHFSTAPNYKISTNRFNNKRLC